MTATTNPDVEPTSWSPRETELLRVALGILQDRGYHGLTVEAVAGAAHASKATIYRRWPSKSELILAAVIEGTRQSAVAPNTGTLRGDLLCLGQIIYKQCRDHASTIRAVLVEISRDRALKTGFFMNREPWSGRSYSRRSAAARSARQQSTKSSATCCQAI